MKRLALLATAFALVASIACSKPKESAEAPPPEETVAPPSAPVEAAAPAEGLQARATLAADAPIPAEALQVWFSAGTGLETDPSGKVTKWTSAAGNGIEAVPMAENATPPVAADGAIGGNRAVRFDGSNQMLRVNFDVNPARVPSMTVFAVFNSRTDAKELRKLYGHDDGDFDRVAGLDSRSDKNYCVFTGQWAAGYFQLAPNVNYMTTDVFTPKAFTGSVNGAVTLDHKPTSHGTGLPELHLGGTGTSFDEFWNGDLAEMIIYSRELSDAEKKQIESYLAGKYGIAVAK